MRSGWAAPLGASAHSVEELGLAARPPAGLEWAFLSPVFQPASKPLDTRPHLGEECLLRAQRTHPSLRVYVLGGIHPSAATRLAAGGAGGIAVLGGVFRDGAATTPEHAADAAREFLGALERGDRARDGASEATACSGTHG